jgi:hypothetical protein
VASATVNLCRDRSRPSKTIIKNIRMFRERSSEATWRWRRR